MRHRNNVKQLGRTHSHRKAMYGNLVTSFLEKERIVTTKEKGKELKRISERLITKAKKNLDLKDDDASKKLHNKREVMKLVKDREVVKKLFENIAPRFKDRKGGYTRLYLLGKRRAGDAAEMALVELVVKETVVKEEKDKAPEKVKAPKKEKKIDKEKDKGKDKVKEKVKAKEKKK